MKPGALLFLSLQEAAGLSFVLMKTVPLRAYETTHIPKRAVEIVGSVLDLHGTSKGPASTEKRRIESIDRSAFYTTESRINGTQPTLSNPLVGS